MTIAVVAGAYGDPWREDQLLVRRFSGALATAHEVDILTPGERGHELGYDGAVRVLRFPADPRDPARRAAWRRAVFGVEDDLGSPVLARPHHVELPRSVEEQLVLSEGGNSPELYQHLRSNPYDLVVFVGHHTPVTLFGVRSLPEDLPFALLPANRHEPTLRLRIHDEVFERAERILVCTESERAAVLNRIGPGSADRVENIGFALGINPLARKTEPLEFDDKRYIVIARDWNKPVDHRRIMRWGEQFERCIHPDLRLRLVGPGAWRVPLGLGRTGSRLDVWRWISRAFALLDPTADRLLGREALEAYLFGTPILTRDDSGASREHADLGNGGLWYRTDEELFGAIEALLDDDVRLALGRQGQEYAELEYADVDMYIKRVMTGLLI